MHLLTTCPRSMPPVTWSWRAPEATVSELAAAGRPSLLVPFPQAADDHQRRNAEVLVAADAAVMLLQADLTAGDVLLSKLSSDADDAPRGALAGDGIERAKTLAHPGALERIGNMIVPDCKK